MLLQSVLKGRQHTNGISKNIQHVEAEISSFFDYLGII